MFKASGYGQGSDPLNTKGAMLLSQGFQGRFYQEEERLESIFLISPGLCPSRDSGVWGRGPDVSPGLCPGDAGQEPGLPAQAVPGERYLTRRSILCSDMRDC